jgi:hypothetical protein
MSANDNDLSRSGTKPEMQDAFTLVEEAAKRGMESVTIDMLKVFINRYLQETLAKAGKKVNLALDSFEDTRGEMEELWGYLRGQLVELAGETRIALNRIADEALEVAREMRLKKEDPEFLKRLLVKSSSRVNMKADVVTKVLVILMAIELLAYLVFFARQHIKTQGFKKVD